MCFSHARSSVDEQRVEDGLCRVECHGFGHAARKFVAFPFYECVEVVVALQVGIQFVHQRLLGNLLDLRLGRCSCCSRMIRLRGLKHSRGRIVDHHHVVHQFASFSEYLVYGLAEQVDELLFQELIKELAGHLQNQCLVLIFQGNDGEEPSLICLRRNIVLYDLKTTIPQRNIICFTHNNYNYLKWVLSKLLRFAKVAILFEKNKSLFSCIFVEDNKAFTFSYLWNDMKIAPFLGLLHFYKTLYINGIRVY